MLNYFYENIKRKEYNKEFEIKEFQQSEQTILYLYFTYFVCLYSFKIVLMVIDVLLTRREKKQIFIPGKDTKIPLLGL